MELQKDSKVQEVVFGVEFQGSFLNLLKEHEKKESEALSKESVKVEQALSPKQLVVSSISSLRHLKV